ncbi:hypothetical protein GCM10010435_72690 [Winogradskya consettensis]|uniref:Uncharacterized protein n=1 Tax=Winogradskya consettensis TaxID=113560 RepID=A0A919T3M0_9ACTN|nr:hypothetical protein [Actinoplanes consettensis]GIM83642.1 hypothetical protein Aco04nite_87580 [Actinoplanes consettensis]
MNDEQARLEQRASDLMNLNAIALEETEQSLHASADRRTDDEASAPAARAGRRRVGDSRSDRRPRAPAQPSRPSGLTRRPACIPPGA